MLKKLSSMITAIILLTPVPAAADWPMLHHDPTLTSHTTEAGPGEKHLLWHQHHGSESHGEPSVPPVVGGRVYTVLLDEPYGFDSNGQLACLDAATGAELWRYSRGDDREVDDHPVVSDGRVYVACTTTPDPWDDEHSTLDCLDAANGSLLWRTSGYGKMLPPVVDDGVIIVTSIEGNYYYGYYGAIRAYDAVTGSHLWGLTGGWGYARPCMHLGKVYITGSSFDLTCLDALTGATVWTRPGDESSTGPTLYAGKLYIRSTAGLLALDPDTGAIIWSAAVLGSYDPLVAANGQLFRVGGGDGYGEVSAVDAETGAINWTRTIDDGRIFVAPAAAGDKLFVSSGYGGWIYCLDQLTGDTIWSDDTGAYRISSPAVAGGRLYVADTYGGVYCYGPGTVNAALTCNPGSGTLPFATQFQVTMANLYADQARRLHYNIGVTLANGQTFPTWRKGWQNVAAGQDHQKNWWQNIPQWDPLVGENLFQLTVTDVTPAPYNQPPYPPAGDTDTDQCTINTSEAH